VIETQTIARGERGAVPNRIAETLEARGMTQARLAELVDAPPGRINQILHGRRSPDVLRALAIAKALNATVEELWS
jgi:transcriptional regulator with XRE-family HTH domain